jgi:hypothetical protein
MKFLFHNYWNKLMYTLTLYAYNVSDTQILKHVFEYGSSYAYCMYYDRKLWYCKSHSVTYVAPTDVTWRQQCVRSEHLLVKNTETLSVAWHWTGCKCTITKTEGIMNIMVNIVSWKNCLSWRNKIMNIDLESRGVVEWVLLKLWLKIKKLKVIEPELHL